MFWIRPTTTTTATRLVCAALLATTAAACPCDIYDAAGTPCVAAHSTTRAMYGAFGGPLYQVMRNSDNKTLEISPLSAGGVADGPAQDAFCGNTTCVISIIYDQSARKNHLTRAPGGAFKGPSPDGTDGLASAHGAPVSLGGKRAYGVFISPGTGYRNNKAQGTAKGDAAQGMYAVLNGFHYNDKCCFDYGNAETSTTDTGNGHMEAIYYGNCRLWGSGAGAGPWVMADLENGLFSGQNAKFNENDPTVQYRFLTAIVKGGPGKWAIRGGDAASGGLSTWYNGPRPKDGYDPMNKEGAIVLGIGGDNSNEGQGTFYEGCMTDGFPSDATEDKVQADIIAAGYSQVPLATGPQVPADGTKVSLRATSACCTKRHATRNGTAVTVAEVAGADSPEAQRKAATWYVRPGLAPGVASMGCMSLEAVDAPGTFLRHAGFVLRAEPNDKSPLFADDATFCAQPAFNGLGQVALRSYSYPTRFVRHANMVLAVGSEGGQHFFDEPHNFPDDASWVLAAGLA